VLISVAVSISTTDAGAAGVEARFLDFLLLLECREVRELERRLGVLDLVEERRLGVLERLCFEEDFLRLLRRLVLLEALGVLERRLRRFAEDLRRLLRRLLPRLGAFGVRDRRTTRLLLAFARGWAARRFLELLGVRARRLLLLERRRDREMEALAERDLLRRRRPGAFGVLARRADRRPLELERRDVEADREDERRLDAFGDLARRLRFLASLVERRRLRRFGVRALREELRRAFLRF